MTPRRSVLLWLTIAAAILIIAAVAITGRTDRPTQAAAPCVQHTFERSVFTVCAFHPERDDFSLAWRNSNSDALRSFAALQAWLGARAAQVRFAMNAGMYDDNGAPIGLYVENGEELHSLNTLPGPGNFHLMPNGVFVIDDDGAHVETTETYALRTEAPIWATQSGPMLVINGALHLGFQSDGPSRYIRNGVGMSDDDGAYFVISEAPVSFGKFARFFRDQLHCSNALFLDGAVSSLWLPATGRMDDDHPLGPMLVVTDP